MNKPTVNCPECGHEVELEEMFSYDTKHFGNICPGCKRGVTLEVYPELHPGTETIREELEGEEDV